MPVLRQVLPAACCSGEVGDLLDIPVIAVKFNIGSPCGRALDIFAEWPGPESHVRQWFLLADGTAVGIVEDPSTGPGCPVVRYAR